MVAFSVKVGVTGNGHDAVFLSRNHGRGPGSLDLGPHVARVVGPVRQHGLVGAQVAHEQARRLRASPACPPVRARVQMRPFAAHLRGSLVVKPARLRPGAYPQGLPFWPSPPLGAPARPWNRTSTGTSRRRFTPATVRGASPRLTASSDTGRRPYAKGRIVRRTNRATTRR